MQNDIPETPAPQPDQDDPEYAEYMAQRKAYTDAFLFTEAISRHEDKIERERDDLRIMSTRLVIEVGKLIQQFGDELCLARLGRPDAFKADECRELLAWQLLSFVSTSSADRDDEFYLLCPRHYQYDQRHAGYWFDTEPDENGTITAIEFDDESDDETESQEAAE